MHQDFEDEVALYRNPALRAIMPDLLHASDNGDRSVCSRSGYAFPAHIIMERGTTLRAWSSDVRNFFEVTTMVEALARLLDGLHCAGFVHRDIKPDNAILLIQSTKWRLLDLGIVARIGESKWPRCTLAYAPPDIVLAAKADRYVTISPAQDMWALGVFCFEATVGQCGVLECFLILASVRLVACRTHGSVHRLASQWNGSGPGCEQLCFRV